MSNALRPTPSTGAPTTATDDDWKATALIFRGQRQALIASNIANADTPKYQARDISFSAALEEASRVRPAAQPAPIATTAPGHLAPTLVAPRNTLQFAEYALPDKPRWQHSRHRPRASVFRTEFHPSPARRGVPG